MEKIEGYVENIIYRNQQNGYTVLEFVAEQKEITCTGVFTDIAEGETMALTGEYMVHKMYGEQFQVSSYEHIVPQDLMSIERYLGSGAIKGVGAALAARIVRHFEEDTFRIIEEEPERLAEVKGISERKAMEIASQVAGKRNQRQAMLFLQQFHISQSMSVKLWERYGDRVYEIIQTNPYRLAEEVDGIGFLRADEIAGQLGIQKDSEYRIISGTLYMLLRAAANGHTCLPMEELCEQTAAMLDVNTGQIEEQLSNMMMDKKIYIRQENGQRYVYSSHFYYMELNTAVMLKNLNVSYPVDEIELEEAIRNVQKKTEITLDEMQIQAVMESMKHGVMILTGGPGTGKTTTINTIIKLFELEGMDIELAAPTGRAAKRMSETTGYEARTIHRLLGLNGEVDDRAGFEHDEDNPLETDVIIIDEMSMVDINLMYHLLKAVVPGTRLILVGDVNQLPSVGPGSVLKDFIRSECISTVMLTKIFRQASQSDIIVNAHKINRGEMVPLDNKSMDFFVLKRERAEDVLLTMLTLILKKMPKYVDATPYDIQVLTPTRKGVLGVENLNKELQKYLNPPDRKKREKETNRITFREGDKVMQTKNNYQMEWEVRSKYGYVIEHGVGIFNGDVGIVEEINTFAEAMTIVFDDNRHVEYPFSQLEDLELAYAITIHKSQGSEYPAVLIPLLGGPRMLMNRNLLYTAVTRAKKCVTVVGDPAQLELMIQNVNEQKRYSGLKNRLLEVYEQ